MTGWPLRTLAEVVAVGSGSGFPIADQGRREEAFPFLKVSDMNLPGNERTISRWNNSVSEEVRARLRATAFPTGSIIFPKIGAAIATNKKRVLTRPSCVDNNVMALVPDRAHLEPEYIYYLLLTKDLRDFASDSNPPSIRKTTVEAWRIPVPPLDDQRRIIDILSRAEGIVRLRREAQKKAAELVPALFMEMFGDPATNPKGWAKVPLCSVAEIISGVTKGRALRPEESIALPYLRVANVKDGHLDLTEVKTILVKHGEVERLLVRPGDLLMTEGGDPDKLGRAALWSGEIERCVHQNHVFKVRCDGDRLSPIYLRSLVGSSYGKAYFLSIAKKTTGIASINKTQLGAFPVPVPPNDLQKAFERHALAAESVCRQQDEAQLIAGETSRALLAKMLSPT